MPIHENVVYLSHRRDVHRLTRAADMLARLYLYGFECGLQGHDVNHHVWLEGTNEMRDITLIGNVAGLRKRNASKRRSEALWSGLYGRMLRKVNDARAIWRYPGTPHRY